MTAKPAPVSGETARTGVVIQIPGSDTARLIVIPQFASDKPLTGDEQLLLALHDALSAASAENERLAERVKWFEAAGGVAMATRIHTAESALVQERERAERALSSLRSFDPKLADYLSALKEKP